MIIKCRFVVPVSAPVIENGAVIVRDGLIDAVGPARELSDTQSVDHGDAVLMPGFVNAHTHLELTHLAGQVPPSADFTDWLSRLMQAFVSSPMTQARVGSAVRSGVTASLAAGVTTVGDITRFPRWTRAALADSAMRGVSFGEVVAVGNRRHLLDERLREACSREHEAQRLQIGISPHAPYTVEPACLRACAAAAREQSLPMCIHLAETVEEAMFTRSASGPFARYLRELGIWDELIPAAGVSPTELAMATGVLTPRTIVAHANYVSDQDIGSLARSGASVAYCPRTHAAFGHAPHRFRDMLSAGVNVCHGTDSLASNPSLSILAEARFLRMQHLPMQADTLIAMATLSGATALGLDDTVGSLDPGKVADLVVIPLDPGGTPRRWETVLDSDAPPAAVYCAGAAFVPGHPPIHPQAHAGEPQRDKPDRPSDPLP